jgi:NADPH2:quinone reductase
MQAVVIDKTGGVEVLKIQKVDEPKPKKNEVVVRNMAIGVNHIDVAIRKGQYKIPNTPLILGNEACGTIVAVGSEVADFKVGDRVAYATAGIGAYAEKMAVNASCLVVPPSDLTNSQVVAVLLKGLMAHTLLHRVYFASTAKKILIHAVAGGIGHLLCQWAKHLGLQVIGTVSSDQKGDFARSIGCDYVINYKSNDFVEEVAKITNYGGVGIVYDSIGKDTINKSLECLWPMGICVSYGESSGATPPIDLNAILENSLYLCRPSLPVFKANRVELALTAEEIFAAVKKGILKPKINEFNFKDVAKAHSAFDNRTNFGSTVLVF